MADTDTPVNERGTTPEDDAWNRAAVFLPQADVSTSRPAVQIGGALVFAYVKRGILVVSVDLDESGLGAGPDNLTPLRVTVQGTEVYATTDDQDDEDDWGPGEGDAWVTLDRAGYSVTMDGAALDNSYRTQEIAVRVLAEAMATAGDFPNAWITGVHGPAYESIDADVAAWHDGNNRVLPLEGIQYAAGTIVRYDDWTWTVDRDYGTDLGVTLYMTGDPTQTAHVTDRAQLTPLPAEVDGR